MSNKQFKPMLAYTIEDTSKIEYPCYVSKKLDGIRCVILDGVVYSRSMKPIRSKVVQKLFGKQNTIILMENYCTVIGQLKTYLMLPPKL